MALHIKTGKLFCSLRNSVALDPQIKKVLLGLLVQVCGVQATGWVLIQMNS